MVLNDDDLRRIYDKNDGYCEYCGKKLSWTNYGEYGEKGSWHVDHSNPRSNGGSDYFRNLFPACIDCNLDKSDLKGTHYRTKFEPATFGGKAVDFLGLDPGTFGASRRRVPR